MTPLAIEAPPEGVDRLRDGCQWALRSKANPTEKIVRAAGQAQQHPPAAQLVEGRRRHSNLGWVLGERVDDARSQLNAPRGACRCRQDDPRAAQEQVVADPEGVEAR